MLFNSVGAGDMRPPTPLRRYAAQSDAAPSARPTRLRVGPKPWGARGNHSPLFLGY